MVPTQEGTPEQIRNILHPRSLAVIGASDDVSKWGGRYMGYLQRHRFGGKVYPINPKADQIFGYKAYPSVAQCPGPVDMAVLLLPRERASQSLAQCAAKGVHSVIAITAGYAEASEEGRRAQDLMVVEARTAGMRIVGPNCMGLLNTHHRLVATTAMIMGGVDTLPVGPVGIVSQSGALMGMMLSRGVDIGVGFSSTISVGNQSDLDLNDFFDYLIEDPLTRVICLYIEETRSPSRFMALLAKARHAGKPVLILKAGRTSDGAQAVSSHTASLAGAYEVFAAACRAQGAYLFEAPKDVVQAAQLLTWGARMSGSGVAVFSGSGGGNALLVDQMEGSGLRLAVLSPDTRAKLVPYMGEGNAALPIDLAALTGASTQGSPLEEVLATVMEDPGVGAGMLLMTTQPNMDYVARSVQAAGSTQTKPLLFIHAAGNIGASARELMQREGYGYLDSTHEALAVLTAFNEQRLHAGEDVAAVPPQPERLPNGYLTEPAARRLLESHGIPTSRWRVATTLEECKRAGAEIGYPLVLKAVSSAVVHKSDHGLVKIRIAGENQLAAAFDVIAGNLARLDALYEGVLVTEMVDVDYELIAGIKNDPSFGPMVLMGSGGVLVEVLKDTSLAQAPLSLPQAKAVVESLKCYPLLQGYRGKAGLSLDDLCMLLVNLSRLALAHKDQLTELDINPLAVANGRLIALDARASTHTA